MLSVVIVLLGAAFDRAIAPEVTVRKESDNEESET